MRTELLDEIIEQFDLKNDPYLPGFYDELPSEYDDDDMCKLDVEFAYKGIKAGYTQRFANLFIAGLTPEEKAYIKKRLEVK